ESDSDIEEDQRSSSEFLADLKAEFHERALLANQRRFYKRSGRDKKLVSSNDEGVTTFKTLMVVADEPSVGRVYARAIGGNGKRKEKGSSKEIIFTKSDVSTFETNPELSSDSESDDNTQRPLPSLPKLMGKAPMIPNTILANIVYLMTITLMSVNSTMGVTSVAALPMKPLTVSKGHLRGNQGFLLSDPQNPLQSGFTKENNSLCYICAGLLKEISCEKGKHHRASFKTKRSFSINKCLHLLHMDLFRPVKPQSISHNKYTLVIVDEYSRYTWVFCLKKKSDAADCIISFIRKMENLNEVKVKELRSDNEKGISQNFSSPYTPEQNDVAERRNITLIEEARTMLNMKRHGKTAYDIFRGRSPDISYFHVFGCPVHIHNYRDHLGKFDENANDGFFLSYSLVAKAFRVFNIRRQEMEETYHVTFSEDDEAISQSSTEGDVINFNEIISFLDDEFQDPRRKLT
ncbi:retrovirus-related pol polyprotein from transposon TNT 1-94, partial [Tanacetum coccineum]